MLEVYYNIRLKQKKKKNFMFGHHCARSWFIEEYV
jgi:hypothetical protein